VVVIEKGENTHTHGRCEEMGEEVEVVLKGANGGGDLTAARSWSSTDI